MFIIHYIILIIVLGETVIEPKKTRGRKPKAPKKVKIIPLGGLEQIGMNITAFEYEDSIFVVDCGLAFPSDDMLGIDLVIPDISYLKDNYLKVKGFCITHGHEDHIGSLPYILKQLNVPVYGTFFFSQSICFHILFIFFHLVRKFHVLQ